MFSSHSHAAASPTVTFNGPGPDNHITAVDSTGQEVARFIAEGNENHFTISRITSPSAPPFVICTGSTSSWSDKTTLNVHGAEMKVKWDVTLSDDAHVILPPTMEKLRWCEEYSLSKHKLVDKSKAVIAKASIEEKKCDVFVPGDEKLFDSLLSSWIAFLLRHKSNILKPGGESDDEDLGTALKVLNVVAKIHGLSN